MKKKVLEIVESFGGGVYTMINDLCNGLSEDFDIVIAYGKRDETPINFNENFNKNIRFIEVKNFTRKINFEKDFKALKEIKKIIHDEKPNIIHLHSSKAGVLGRLAASGKKYRMLYNPHGFSFLKQDDSKLKRFCYKTIEKMMSIINHKCIIVGCSQGEYEEAKKISKNSVCINNGINIEKLEKEIKNLPEHEIDFNNLKICTIGRIGYQKNPKCFNEIAQRFSSNKFTWIGNGELRNKLTSPNITVTGWKNKKEVLEELNNNDIFILTSLWEGLPISLLEAGYMKKLCMVSDVIGNRDVIKNNINGYIFNNYNKITNIIKNIKEEQYKELTNKLYNEIKENYNLECMTKKYKDIYEELIR